MPTYGYRCEKNGHEFEVFQSMTDEPLQRCTICRSPVRRIFYPVGIVFKGPGFYKTDSRGSSPASAPAATGDGDKSDTAEAAPAAPAGVDKADKADKTAAKSDSGAKSENKSKKSESRSGSRKSA
jgi:putative FmdB family regulatory protein